MILDEISPSVIFIGVILTAGFVGLAWAWWDLLKQEAEDEDEATH
jgi:hypothetical protein